MKTKTTNKENSFEVPENCSTFEDLLTREYGEPGSIGRDRYEIGYVNFLKKELRKEKNPLVKEEYKQQIAYYSKKHNLKM